MKTRYSSVAYIFTQYTSKSNPLNYLFSIKGNLMWKKTTLHFDPWINQYCISKFSYNVERVKLSKTVTEKEFAYYIMLQSVPGINQSWAMRMKLLAQGNNSYLSYKSDMLTIALTPPLVSYDIYMKCWKSLWKKAQNCSWIVFSHSLDQLSKELLPYHPHWVSCYLKATFLQVS